MGRWASCWRADTAVSNRWLCQVRRRGESAVTSVQVTVLGHRQEQGFRRRATRGAACTPSWSSCTSSAATIIPTTAPRALSRPGEQVWPQSERSLGSQRRASMTMETGTATIPQTTSNPPTKRTKPSDTLWASACCTRLPLQAVHDENANPSRPSLRGKGSSHEDDHHPPDQQEHSTRGGIGLTGEKQHAQILHGQDCRGQQAASHRGWGTTVSTSEESLSTWWGNSRFCPHFRERSPSTLSASRSVRSMGDGRTCDRAVRR